MLRAGVPGPGHRQGAAFPGPGLRSPSAGISGPQQGGLQGHPKGGASPPGVGGGRGVTAQGSPRCEGKWRVCPIPLRSPPVRPALGGLGWGVGQEQGRGPGRGEQEPWAGVGDHVEQLKPPGGSLPSRSPAQEHNCHRRPGPRPPPRALVSSPPAAAGGSCRGRSAEADAAGGAPKAGLHRRPFPGPRPTAWGLRLPQVLGRGRQQPEAPCG